MLLRRARHLLLALTLAGQAVPATTAAPAGVWIGTFGKGEAAGVYRADFDPATGKLGLPARVAAIEGAGFLAIAPDRRHVLTTADGPAGGQIALWKPGTAAARWELLGRQDTGGGVCHVSVSADGATVMAANYGGGSIASFRHDRAGTLSPRVSMIRHEGSGPSLPRQDGPHPHAVVPMPGGKFAAVPDLGLDAILVYRIDPVSSALAEHSRVATPPGSGPRHLAVHADGMTVYAINELDASVCMFRWDPTAGVLTPAGVVAGRPAGWPAKDLNAAEIRIRPDGKFLYSSVRDLSPARRDYLAVFALAADGKPTFAGHVPAGVALPRNFAISPDGRWLLAGGQKSNDIQVHAIDPASGMPTPAGAPVACPSPVCFVFEP